LAGLAYVLFFNNGNFEKLFDIFKQGDEPISIQQQPGEETAAVEAGSAVGVKKIIIDNTVESKSEPPVSQSENAKQVSKEELTRMAASFVERFGSYSNQSNFSNIIDLRIFMSSRMQRWADNYVGNQRLKYSSDGIYYGITTKAIAQEVIEFDDHIGQAVILVNTRRREAISSTNNTQKVFSQDVVINFLLEKGAWKVDSANWAD
ncbi:MAG: hypothetical protein U9R06_01880, partial [Patescibacteria group bacterium]|nr:hypothetical protein [Patescibacteria group bacterium]